MSNARATKGGQVGVNGEFYEGGKFLPSTKQPKRPGSARRGGGRCLIEPGVFADAPEGKGSVMGAIGALARGTRSHSFLSTTRSRSSAMAEPQPWTR